MPHYHSTIRATLEAIAQQASRYSGVILLSQDRQLTDAFAAAQPDPELFHILSAPYNTPWLRDRSPIAVKQGSAVHWVLPQLDTPDRPLDEQLFQSLTRRPVETTRLELPGGNLVAGPRGRAVVLMQEQQDEREWRKYLLDMKNVLGVAQWILAPAFSQEVTGHADVHVRFLGPKLAAVAWSRDNPEDRERIACLEARVAEALPGIHIMRLPLRSEGPHYASPVNWLQFGRHLLLPRYDLTPAEDIHAIKQTLADRGFHITFIHSPTLEYAGSLHCLTASVYA